MATEVEVLNGLLQRGIPAHIAQGIVTGMKAESGLNPGINEIKPLVPGSRGGYGLNQWTGPRRVAYENFAKSRGAPLDDLATQLDFTMTELQGPESRAWAALQGAKTPEEAARLYETQFLRPGIPHGGRRETLSTSGLLSEAPMDEPQQGPLGGLLGIKRDTSKINDLGLALMALSSPRAAPAFMEMAKGRREEAAGRRKEQQQAQQAGRTIEWLSSQPGGAQFAALADALGPQAAVQAYMQAQKAVAGGGTEYGLNPQYGVDKDGNPVLIQIGKNGEAIQTALPEGVSLSREPIKLDAGTHFVLLDPITRQPVGTIPKENRAAASETARGTVEGKALGEAEVAAGSLGSKMGGLEEVVGKLRILSDQATYTTTGQVIDWARKEAGAAPREAAVARTQYEAIVNNQILPLLRDTFGAQFTEREGQTLRETLGSPDKTPAEKQAVLTAFIEQKRRDLAALQAQSGESSAATAPDDPLGLRK